MNTCAVITHRTHSIVSLVQSCNSQKGLTQWKHQAAHLALLYHVSRLNLQHLCRQANPIGCAIDVNDNGRDAVPLKKNILHT